MCWRRTRGTASWSTSSRWGLNREGKVKLDTLCRGAVLSKGLFYQVVQYYIPQSGGGSIQEEDEDLAVTESEVRHQYSCVIFMAMVAIMKLLLSTRWPIQILGAGHWSLMWAWPTGELEEEGKSTVLNSCIQELQAHLWQEDCLQYDWHIYQEEEAVDLPSGGVQQQDAHCKGGFPEVPHLVI